MYYHLSVTLGETKITVLESGMGYHRPTQDASIPDYIHTHKAYELFAAFEDFSLVTKEGERTLSDCLVLIPPGFEHFRKSSGKTYTLLFSVSESEEKLFPERTLSIRPFSTLMKTYLNELENAFLLNDLPNTQKRRALYTLFLLELSALTAPKFSPVYESRERSYAETISNILSEEFREDIKLEYIANRLHLSTKQTTRVLQKLYNRTLPQLLLYKRLSVAANYLCQTNLKIVEVMTLSGFTTENHFFAVFKKHYGLTPRAYRAKMTEI